MSSGQGDETVEANDRGEALAEVLLFAAFERVESYGRVLPSPLRELWLDAYGRWQVRQEPGGPTAQFLGPSGTPCFTLLAWAAESLLDEPESEPALAAAEAMLTEYFALRFQDDVVDDGTEPTLAYLFQALEARAVALMVDVSASPAAMHEEWSSLVEGFAAAALDDVRLRADPSALWDEVAIEAQGRKFLPMAGPVAALLLRSGRGEDLPALRRAVCRLSVGLQLTNDVAGVESDLASGERTPYVAALDLVPGLHGAADVEPALRKAIRRGAQQGFMEQAKGALSEASPLFSLLPSATMADHIGHRLERLEDHERELMVRALSTARPLLADVELTRRCDLSCPSCFVRAQEPGRSLAEAAELRTELVFEVLEELSGYPAMLHLTGGEPFLYPGIWGVLARARELGLDQVVINTNGVALSEGALERLGETGLQITLLVSLDGPPGAHDRCRGKGVEAAALDVLRRGPTFGVEAEVATVLTAELVAYGIDEWHRWLAERIGRVPALSLWPLFLKPGEPARRGAFGSPADPASAREAARQIADLMVGGHEVTVACGPVLGPLLRDHGVAEEKIWTCNGGRERLCVQADCTVSPCHPFRHPLGRLEAGRVGGFVARAFGHPDARCMAARDYEGCRDCDDRHLCCACQARVEARSEKDDPFGGNDWYCRALREQTGPDARTRARGRKGAAVL